MITTLSAAMRRRWISSAGKAWRLQNQRPAERDRGPVLLEQLEQLVHVGPAEALLVFERQLEQAGLQVAGEEQEVVGVDQPLLRIGAEEVLGVADDELVERRARRDEHADRAGPPPRPAQLLPGGRDGPRVADEDRGLQAADVDAQLERVGADDAGDLAAAQAGLDLPPVQGQVAGAVAAHALGGVEPRREVLAQVAEHHLDLQAAAAEHDRLDARRGSTARRCGAPRASSCGARRISRLSSGGL